MKGDSWIYIGLGLGAVGLVVTVVGLGEKVFFDLLLVKIIHKCMFHITARMTIVRKYT